MDHEDGTQTLPDEIGKPEAPPPEAENPREVEAAQHLAAEVQEYKKEIQQLKDRIAELEAHKTEEAPPRHERDEDAGKAGETEKTSPEQINRAIAAAIQESLRHGVFETMSERAIFDKVANDLLDSEMEIKILAATELGKMGNEAAVPLLCEVAGFDQPSLTSEVINSLINLGDSRAIPLFKDKVNDPKYRVRIGCLRGLYKLGSDQEARPFLVEALGDEHPEVRRTAATFIGWKDYAEAAPALAESLRDEDDRVRKAAISSLANIKDESSVLPLIKVLGDRDPEVREKALDAIKIMSGKDLSFDIHASGDALAEAIEAVRDWWQKERLNKVDLTETEKAVAAYPEREAAEAALEEEEAPVAAAGGLEQYPKETEAPEMKKLGAYEVEGAAEAKAGEAEDTEEPKRRSGRAKQKSGGNR
jgi:HEAT repeat protein